jgi:hypothetical protein
MRRLVLEAPARSRSPTPAPAAVPARKSRSGERERAPRHGVLTYASLGVGAVGVIGGLAFGGLAWRDKSTVDRECDGHLCSHDGKVAADRGRAFATVSTVSLGVGLAALGLGATLFVSESSGDSGRTVGLNGVW